MAKESATAWQQRLDREGTVVIRSRQPAATWLLLGCVAVAAVGVVVLFGGGVASVVAGLVMIGAGGFGMYRVVRARREGRPHLVVTAERLEYDRHSLPWSAVHEVVRHTRTVRGDTTTYVWILHGGRDRLRLPDTLLADTWELGGWLSEVHARQYEVG